MSVTIKMKGLFTLKGFRLNDDEELFIRDNEYLIQRFTPQKSPLPPKVDVVMRIPMSSVLYVEYVDE